MPSFPRSYKDPLYSDIDSATETKLGLPSGLLAAIRLHGERSNADQVSEASAKTPYQFIPATRDAVVKKFGIDPLLSPENAAEAAGLLLKESLARNGNDEAAAVAEYHGGTDRANWGRKTAAYVERVTSALQAQREQANSPASQIGRVYEAYQAGQMTPEEAAEFEADVNAGTLMLPRGAVLKASAAPEAAGGNGLPAEVLAAYQDGRMTREERMDLERDVASGAVALPQGAKLGKTEPLGIVGGIAESVTGSDRRTPETEAAPDWVNLPELNHLLSIPALKANVGTFFAMGPDEMAQIITSNFPNAQTRKDERGNVFIRSAEDGKEYAIKPGFRPSDIPKTAGALLAFSPASKATTVLGGVAADAATQAGIEAVQAGTGGSFDPSAVALAGATGGAFRGGANLIEAAKPAVVNAVNRIRANPAEVTPVAASAAPVAEAAPIPPAAPTQAAVPEVMSLPDLAAAAGDAGRGSKAATETLAEQAAPDPKAVAAADSLGIREYLQPDHVSTNQAFVGLSGWLKSKPMSPLADQEAKGLEEVAKRADGLIREIGGTKDYSVLSSKVKAQLEETQGHLDDYSEKLYGQLRGEISPLTPSPAPNVLGFIDARAEELGGKEFLTSAEKTILRNLSPRKVPAETELPAWAKELQGRDTPEAKAMLDAIKAQAPDTEAAIKEPTYALLDQTRRDLGAAFGKNQGPFKDSESGLLRQLYARLSADQEAVAAARGHSDLFVMAKRTVEVRKGIEDDLTALFGKEMDKSIVPELSKAFKDLSKGNETSLERFISAVPQSMRGEVVASGLATAFTRAAERGSVSFKSYSDWYEGLIRNKKAFAAVMTNLPKGAPRRLSALYRVSRGIQKAKEARIWTGRANMPLLEAFNGADSLMSKVIETAKRSAVTVAAETATTSVGLHGVGTAATINNILKPNKSRALEAAAEVMASPEFQQAAMAAAAGDAKKAASILARAKAFSAYVKALNGPRELRDREGWILRALQANNQQQDSE